MDTTSAVMGLGLLFLFVAPIGYLLYGQSSKDKKRTKKLAFISAKKGLNLTETEHLDDLSLGFDPKSNVFLIYQLHHEHPKIINVDQITAVELLKVDDVGKKVENLDDVREIFLHVRLTSGASEDIVFYTEEDNAVTQKEGRFKKAGKWQVILTSKSKK